MRDMREILLMAKADAPPARHSVEDIVAAGRRRRRRSFAVRAGGSGMVAAAVATIAVLVTVNLAVPGSSTVLLQPVVPPTPTAPAPSPPFTFTFAGYRVGDYRVLAPDEVTLTFQSAGVLRDVRDAKGTVTTRYVGTLKVYQPGMFDPEDFRTGARLTVQGRDAYQAKVERELLGSWDTSLDRVTVSDGLTAKTFTTDGLAWQYAPDAWAVLEGEITRDGSGFPPADQLALAERFAVTGGEPVRAKLPFRTGYLPAGFTLRSISGQSMTAENRGMTTFVYAKAEPSAPGRAPSVVLSILWVDSPPPDAKKRTSRCNAGQHWCTRTLPGGEFWLAVEDPSKTLTDQELLKVADSLTFATIKDTGTWFPAT